jgi:hypothetical protein
MCINSIPRFTSYKKDGTASERIEKLITIVMEEYDLDISIYRDEMIEAETRDKLEFTFIGPGTVYGGKFEYRYNCYLHIPGASFYFFSEKGFNKKMPAVASI